jgi:hypothetical protein
LLWPRSETSHIIYSSTDLLTAYIRSTVIPVPDTCLARTGTKAHTFRPGHTCQTMVAKWSIAFITFRCALALINTTVRAGPVIVALTSPPDVEGIFDTFYALCCCWTCAAMGAFCVAVSCINHACNAIHIIPPVFITLAPPFQKMSTSIFNTLYAVKLTRPATTLHPTRLKTRTVINCTILNGTPLIITDSIPRPITMSMFNTCLSFCNRVTGAAKTGNTVAYKWAKTPVDTSRMTLSGVYRTIFIKPVPHALALSI